MKRLAGVSALLIVVAVLAALVAHVVQTRERTQLPPEIHFVG
jgi:hypothetical protein